MKQMMIDLDSKIKKKLEKKTPGYFDLPEDIDQAWIEEHQKVLVEEEKVKIEKKFNKENEKLAADKEKEMKQTELKERLKVVSDLEKKFAKENKTKKVEAEGRGPTQEKYEAAVEKLDQRIANMLLQAEDKEGNKEVALGTSKIVSHPHLYTFYQN
jgi:DNA topoisomerase I